MKKVVLLIILILIFSSVCFADTEGNRGASTAQYLVGSLFNVKIKELSGNSGAGFNTTNYSIRKIEWQSGTFSVSDVPEGAINVGETSLTPI